jgi:hypothetical protein
MIAPDEERDNDNDSPLNHHSLPPLLIDKREDEGEGLQPTNLPLLTTCYISALTTGATTYAFSFYSSDLKSKLLLSQNQLDTLSSATFVAGLVSWIPGLIVDRYGPRFAMIVGSVCNAILLTYYWLLATKRIKLLFHYNDNNDNSSNKDQLVFVLSCLSVIIFMGSALITGSVFKIIVESCTSSGGSSSSSSSCGSKGKGVECAKGYIGVGSGVYVCLFGALFGSSSSSSSTDENSSSLNFLLMAAVLFIMAVTLPAVLLLPKKQKQLQHQTLVRDGTRDIHFWIVYLGLISLGLLVVGTSLRDLHANEQQQQQDPKNDDYSRSSTNRQLFSSDGTNWGNTIFILLLWWGPALSLLCVPPRKASCTINSSMINCSEVNATNYIHENTDEPTLAIDEVYMIRSNSSNVQDANSLFLNDDQSICSAIPSTDHGVLDIRDRGFTLAQMLQTSTAWLMAWTYMILVGGGTLMTTNIGQMTQALGFDHATTSASLAFFSAAQGASRVCTGIVSEKALGWTNNLPRWFCGCCLISGDVGIPRPVFLSLASLVGATAHFILAVSTSKVAFVLGVTMSGISFGMVWPLMVLITGEVFGNRCVGANYMFFDGLSSAVGTLLITKFIAQEVYDGHIAKSDPVAEPNSTCIGSACFALTHSIVTVLLLTCLVSSSVLVRSTRLVQNNRQGGALRTNNSLI